MNYKVTKDLKETQRQMADARKSASIGSDVYSLHACDDSDDDEDELELIEGGSFIEDGPSVQGTRSAEDTGVATPNDYWEYAVSGFTKTCQEFSKAINKFDERAGIKCKETADIIDDTANWKFPKEHRDAYYDFVNLIEDASAFYDFVDLIEDASAYSDTTCGSMSCNTDSTCSSGYTTTSGRSGVTEATGYTTATNVTEATGKTACTAKSGRSGTTEVTATNATGLTGPSRERPEKYPEIEVVYNNQADRTKRPQVTKKTRECPPHERSKLSNIPDEVPSHGGEDNSIFGGDATQRSSTLPIASSERPSLGDLEPPDQLSNVSAKSRASVLEPSDLTLDRSLAQTIPSDLTITGRPGRYESYITSRFGVTWGNAEKAAAPIAENIPIL